jgi:cell division transport system permease protein
MELRAGALVKRKVYRLKSAMDRRKKRNNAKTSKQNVFSGNHRIDRLYAYFNNHGHTLFSSLGRLSRTPLTTSMTVAVLAVAIALAGSFYILVVNIQQLAGNLEASNQISIFLKQHVAVSRGEQLAAQIAKDPKIKRINFISPDQAMAEFKIYSGFGEALNALDSNPLPAVIQVLPINALESQKAIKTIISKFQKLPEVDFVQMDMQWVERLQAIIEIARKAISAMALLLAMAVIFITGNTIRLELQNRREEVLIAKLVGATDAFIQRPFLYSGFWYGFLAGVFAWVITTMMLLILQQPVENLSALYDHSFNLHFLNFTEAVLLILIASMLGIVGSWIVLMQQLKTLKPE